MFKHLGEQIDAVMERDPAARSRLEVVLCYPGFHAVLLHRAAHGAWKRGWFLLGRCISHLGRLLTGIEIHPGARIGRRLFIDHGMGVVIGESAELGDNVTLYQGVTLGGVSPAVNSGSQANTKRHPTLEDDVIVGSGAQVLGPITVGRGARVGGNAVVVRHVPPGVSVVGIPAKAVGGRRDEQEGFCAYAVSGDVPDPTARSIDGLLGELQMLNARVAELERQLADRPMAGEAKDAGGYAAQGNGRGMAG